MANKDIKRKRMIGYFLDAAVDIIREEGLDAVSIRKIADRAGYNSATIYNYFENLDHLVSLAALKCLEPYIDSIHSQVSGVEDALQRYLLVWDLFCQHSFQNPELYQAVFFAPAGHAAENYHEMYYDLFPPPSGSPGCHPLDNMLSQSRIDDRNRVILQDCVDAGYFRNEDLEDLNDMSIMLYKGTLSKMLEDPDGIAKSNAYAEQCRRYISHCCRTFLQR